MARPGPAAGGPIHDGTVSPARPVSRTVPVIPASLIMPAGQRNPDTMRLHWYPLSIKEAGLLLLVFVMSGIFGNLQPYFVSSSLIPFTYAFFLFLLMLAYFPLVRPQDPLALGTFLALLLGAIYAVMIVLVEVVGRHNYSWGSLVVLAGAVLSPLVAAGIYHLLFARRPPR